MSSSTVYPRRLPASPRTRLAGRWCLAAVVAAGLLHADALPAALTVRDTETLATPNHLGFNDVAFQDGAFVACGETLVGSQRRAVVVKFRDSQPPIIFTPNLPGTAPNNHSTCLSVRSNLMLGWGGGASNGFGSYCYLAKFTDNLTLDTSFGGGDGIVTVKRQDTTQCFGLFSVPNGYVSTGFVDLATADSEAAAFLFSRQGTLRDEFILDASPNSDSFNEGVYDELNKRIVLVGNAAPGAFAQGLVSLLNPNTFNPIGGPTLVPNPTGHEFYNTAVELGAFPEWNADFAAVGVQGNRGVVRTFKGGAVTGAVDTEARDGLSDSALVPLVSKVLLTDPGNFPMDVCGNAHGTLHLVGGNGGGDCNATEMGPNGQGEKEQLTDDHGASCDCHGCKEDDRVEEIEPPGGNNLRAASRVALPAPALALNQFVVVGRVAKGGLFQGALAVVESSDKNTSPCVPDINKLCLSGGRFEVTAFHNPGPATSQAKAASLTADTGYFYFLNPANVELVVKIVNACGLQRFWVFGGGLTNVGVVIVVRDTKTGEVKRYVNPIGQPFQPLQDTDGFATCPVVAEAGLEPILTFEDGTSTADQVDEVAPVEPPAPQSLETALTELSELESAALAADLERLSSEENLDDGSGALLHRVDAPINLRNGRFKVEATFKTPTGPTTAATGVLITDETAYFRFLNPANVEVIVKIVNGCSFATPRFWVFGAGLTNLRVDITVTDTKTGAKKVYTNNQGVAFKPIQDVNAFATCP